MPLFTIIIKRQGGKVVFAPSQQNAWRGDKIVWKNEDNEAHWPMKEDGKDDSLMKHKIPGSRSSASEYEIEKGIEVIEVRCAVDGHTEEGSIKVVG